MSTLHSAVRCSNPHHCGRLHLKYPGVSIASDYRRPWRGNRLDRPDFPCRPRIEISPRTNILSSSTQTASQRSNRLECHLPAQQYPFCAKTRIYSLLGRLCRRGSKREFLGVNWKSWAWWTLDLGSSLGGLANHISESACSTLRRPPLLICAPCKYPAFSRPPIPPPGRHASAALQVINRIIFLAGHC